MQSSAETARIAMPIGHRYRVARDYEVGREKIREFARAIQNYHPVHFDETEAQRHGYPGLLAPPTFVSLLGGTAQQALSALLPEVDLAWAVQTDQVLHLHRPVVTGDTLTCVLSLCSFRRAFGGDLLVVENDVRNQCGERAITAYTSFTARSDAPEDDSDIATLMPRLLRHDVGRTHLPLPALVPLGAATEDHTDENWNAHPLARSCASTNVGDPLPERIFRLSLGDLVNYAGVSGDPNPIHWHRTAATTVGLDDTVAHGMLTMGLGAGFLADWVGDPGAIRQYSVRMTSPVYVFEAGERAEVVFAGRVKSLDPSSGTAQISLTATQGTRRVFGRATAIVQLS
ncbi:fused (3R)-hydroxyacyl-ACP dehydratase subunits HadA/HadB [Nocardia pseudobrasiliensis]|uniref:Acyl dehydratase n=1 Tax=Nocardia pseudobrasiliensis TaxID=45979 RepID=A0A370IBW1_9NOCA|nr:fused (3R)-hydroxyacyl-ACP dehydratase subunits HadA/HadB [Nocardia pseudobrasiliensis]RDI68225.1 acyl dehydratase [Nocardia pseudobrasiliensis]